MKDQIVKIVYDFNDPSFKNRFVTVTDSRNGYGTKYNGDEYLSNLEVTIYFDDNTTESFTIDVCKELGW